MKGKFYLLTFGCQMNKHDSERIAGLLLSLGFKETKKPKEADILMINTCSVRQSAEDRVYGFIYNWQEFRKNKPNLIIAVTGCMPGRDKDGKIRKKIQGVDLFFGIEELPMLPKWVGELGCHCEPPQVAKQSHCFQGTATPSFARVNSLPSVAPRNENFCYLTIQPAREIKYKASITVQTGCNNFCTYCVVPYARGREKNRPVKDILDEIKKAADEGCREVHLLGQVINNYKVSDKLSFPRKRESAVVMSQQHDDFATILQKINQIAGIERIHWTAADPQYFNDAQIAALKLPKQVNYLHLAAQSGDNEILSKMNRHYTREQYIDLIKKIRAARPNIAIGTDLIVGFPGETEEQFQNTVDLYKQCDFDIAYLAMYSERSGTAAAKAFKDDISHEEKKRRWQVIQDLMEETVLRKNQKYLGQTVSVLVERFEGGVGMSPPHGEGEIKRGCSGICTGNSSEMKLVQFAGGPELVGQIVNVKITRPEMWILIGGLI